MSRLLRKLVCFLGLHFWSYESSDIRECRECKRKERWFECYGGFDGPCGYWTCTNL